jgi:hypothetical protein
MRPFDLETGGLYQDPEPHTGAIRPIRPTQAIRLSMTIDTPLSYLRSFGPAADPITNLGWGLITISLLVMAIIAALLLMAIFRRRDKATLDAQGHLPVGCGVSGMLWIYI